VNRKELGKRNGKALVSKTVQRASGLSAKTDGKFGQEPEKTAFLATAGLERGERTNAALRTKAIES